MKGRVKFGVAAITLLATVATARAQSEPSATRHLTLQEAVQLALVHNHVVQITKLQIDEKKHALDVARSSYYPKIDNETRVLRVTDTQFIDILTGSLGTIDGTKIPATPLVLNQGGNHFVTSGTGIAEPLTQLITKIKPANDVARADVSVASASARQTANEIAVKVRQIYYGMLIAQLHHDAAESKIEASQELEQERGTQVKYGAALDQDLIESQAATLASKQDLLTTELQLSDLNLQLDDALGLPLSTKVTLDAVAPDAQRTYDRDDCIKSALAAHPEIAEAQANLTKALAAERLAKGDYIPDISIFARYSYSDRVPFLARNFGTFGVQFSYDLFDGGRRHAELEERGSQIAEARENLARVTDEVELGVDTALNRLDRTRQMIGVSQQVLSLRTESHRLYTQQIAQGAALKSQNDNAAAQELEAKTSLLQSQLDYSQAQDQLLLAMGQTPQ
jgi:outer membrane protein TolC